MSGHIDLHCHVVVDIDDGVKTIAEARELLLGLSALGFDRVIATPHMRPGLFDNTREQLERAFELTTTGLREYTPQAADGARPLPTLQLSSEHYFDDVVYERLLSGEGVPYPGGNAVLLEFWEMELPPRLDGLLARLSRMGLTPVIAHPERYRLLWEDPARLERLLDVGCVALLDTAALVGKYGKGPKRCAEALLEAGHYEAACSDSHRPSDLEAVAGGMTVIRQRYGDDEIQELFTLGPLRILEGTTAR